MSPGSLPMSGILSMNMKASPINLSAVLTKAGGYEQNTGYEQYSSNLEARIHESLLSRKNVIISYKIYQNRRNMSRKGRIFFMNIIDIIGLIYLILYNACRFKIISIIFCN